MWDKDLVDEETIDFIRGFIRQEVMTSKEVTEYLDFSRVRLGQIVEDGRITPVISGVYMRREIEQFKKMRDGE